MMWNMRSAIYDRLRLPLAFLCCALAFSLPACNVARRGYEEAKLKADEAALLTALSHIREALQQYQLDHGAPPAKLEEIVSGGYMNQLPIDPITGNADWTVVFVDCPPSPDCKPAVKDIHSASKKTSSRGDQYSTW